MHTNVFYRNNELNKMRSFFLDYDLISLLANFLVVEKQDEYMQTWLLTKVPPDVERALGKGAFTWRSVVWTSLVRAEAYWGGNNAADARDAAIRRFFHIYGLRQQHFGRGSADFAKMSAWSPTLALGNILTRARQPSHSPELFDRFIGFVRGFQAKDSGLLYGRLALFHPVRPNPYPLLEFCQTKEEDQRFLTNDKGLTVRKIGAHLTELGHMLEALQKIGDAENVKVVQALRQDREQLATKIWGASTTRFNGASPGDSPHLPKWRSRTAN